jgi:hypothetical protein
MLRSGRRFIPVVVALAVAAMTSVTPALADPPADPGDGCSFLLCGIPSDPAEYVAGGLDFGNGVGVDIGNVLTDGCRALNDPVSPADSAGRTAPTGVAGKWAYQVCGDPAVVVQAVRQGNARQIGTWCSANRACSVIVAWKPDNPDPNVRIPVDGGPGGILQYFTLSPDAASSPGNGQVITNFPTWFYDANHLDFTGLPIPAFPIGGFGGAATAIHIRSWWDVDGREICGKRGRTPAESMPLSQAANPSPDCGVTFAKSGAHNAETHATWLIIVLLAFPPYIIVFPITLSDDIDLNAREVQADTQ